MPPIPITFHTGIPNHPYKHIYKINPLSPYTLTYPTSNLSSTSSSPSSGKGKSKGKSKPTATGIANSYPTYFTIGSEEPIPPTASSSISSVLPIPGSDRPTKKSRKNPPRIWMDDTPAVTMVTQWDKIIDATTIPVSCDGEPIPPMYYDDSGRPVYRWQQQGQASTGTTPKKRKPGNSNIAVNVSTSNGSNSTSTTTTTTNLSPSGLATPTPTLGYRFILPHQRVLNLVNDRSKNPSPKEILKAALLEEKKYKLGQTSTAAARAAKVLEKKTKPDLRKGKGTNRARQDPGPKSGSLARVRVSGSPAVNLTGGIEPVRTRTLGSPAPPLLDKPTTIPTITTENPSLENTPTPTNTNISTIPVPTRATLKRTRSAGPLNISAAQANALGNGVISVGSPLKAVMGPEDASTSSMTVDDGQVEEEEEVDPEEKKRLGKRRKSNTNTETIKRIRGSTTSPQITEGNLLPGNNNNLQVPKTYPLAAGVLAPAKVNNSRSLSLSRENGGGVASVAMRRVASASGVPASAGSGSGSGSGSASRTSRQGSTGPGGVGLGVRERSGREVIMPKALKDYDTRATGVLY